jgi:hypothetical protein
MSSITATGTGSAAFSEPKQKAVGKIAEVSVPAPAPQKHPAPQTAAVAASVPPGWYRTVVDVFRDFVMYLLHFF